jgi:hypothetical protein
MRVNNDNVVPVCEVKLIKPGEVFRLGGSPYIMTDVASSNGIYPVVNLRDGHYTGLEGRMFVEKVDAEINIKTGG